MDSTEDIETATVNNYERPEREGGDKAFINKLLGEMKNQFNKTDRTSGRLDDEPGNMNVGVSVSGESKIRKSKEINNKVNGSTDVMMLFKKPNNSESPSRKEASPGRRSLRLKTEETNAQTVPKRSSRRRSKDCNESILQSAIARKVKSYNESSKPQRLTRQLKPTQKILKNLALAKQEKNKLKSAKNSDSDVQQSDDTSCSDIPKKIRKKQQKTSNVRTKKMKLAHDESDGNSESDESASADSENNIESPKSARRSLRLSR